MYKRLITILAALCVGVWAFSAILILYLLLGTDRGLFASYIVLFILSFSLFILLLRDYFSDFPVSFSHKKTKKHKLFKKHEKNPILAPRSEYEWESRAAFNTAAVQIDNKVHFVYRAMGNEDISVLGYAASSDGLTIDTRLPYPIYIPREPFELPAANPAPYSPYASGGGYGGCEDPRLTLIGKRVYMTYVAYNGADPPRVALTSISTDDFLSRRWDWARPVLISRPGEVNKNAVIFPEKINGKYVIFHRVFPNILIDYVDTLKFDNKTHLQIKAKIPVRRPPYWDSRKIGAGPPPVKTDDGWLLIYHAVDDLDDSRYKIGAMLLDEKDPSRVLARTNEPLIEPDRWYENEGFKAGVVYPCGAAVLRDKLYLYYGGADTVVCAATAPLKQLIHNLKTEHAQKYENTRT